MKIRRADDWLLRWAQWTQPLQVALGDVAATLAGVDTSQVKIERPIFLAGLARAGTTILLESLSRADGLATHRYRDFPFVFSPLLWNRFLDFAPSSQAAVERAHRDRILITRDSPDSFEEPIWQSFFPEAHRPDGRHLLTAADRNPRFERFFPEHLRQILSLGRGTRYLSKGNYNVTRMEYLLRLFPDARFVVPVREPLPQVLSLCRQHELFVGYAQQDARVPRHLAAAGHYEFGPQRVPIQCEPGRAQRIISLWNDGQEARGYAAQWAEINRLVADQRDRADELSRRMRIVRYEDFCRDPHGELRGLIEFLEIDPAAAQPVFDRLPEISAPDRSEEPAPEIVRAVREETAEVAARFGYET